MHFYDHLISSFIADFLIDNPGLRDLLLNLRTIFAAARNILNI